jgi:hypothetical protein
VANPCERGWDRLRAVFELTRLRQGFGAQALPLAASRRRPDLPSAR